MVGSCEHGNEPSSCIKGEEFLDELSYYQFLKKGSAPEIGSCNIQHIKS